MGSLEDVLSDKEPVIPVETEPSNAEPVVVKNDDTDEYKSRKKALQEKEWTARGMIRDPETGQFVAKAEKAEEPKKEEPKVEPPPEVKPEVKAEPKPAAMTEKEVAFLRGLEDERRKRQALEQELERLRAAAPKEPEKGFWDDPEGSIKTMREQFNAEILKTRVTTSEAIVRSQHEDFDEKVGVFVELAQATPGLYQQMISAPNPAEFAYKVGKNHFDIRQAGSVDNLKAQLEKEVRAKLEQEYREKEAALEKQRAELPKSLTDVRGVTTHKPVWGGPTPLDTILGKS